MNSRERIEQRQKDAAEREQERAARGDAGQLRRLESDGFGECKEARRLRVALLGGEPAAIEIAPDKE
jgi:hypothetical protein